MALNSGTNNGNNGGQNRDRGNQVNSIPIYAPGHLETAEGAAASYLSISPNGYNVAISISPKTGVNNGKPIYDHKNKVTAYVNQQNVATLIAAAKGVASGAIEKNAGTTCSNQGTNTLISVGKGKSFPNVPGVSDSDSYFLRIASFSGNGGTAFHEFSQPADMIVDADPQTGHWEKMPTSVVPGCGNYGLETFIEQLEENHKWSFGSQSGNLAWDFRFPIDKINKMAGGSRGNNGGSSNQNTFFSGNGSDGYSSNYSSSSLDVEDLD